MKIDIVNVNKETVGSLELKDDVFGGRVKTDLIWEAVVHQNAQEHKGTHATKNRALVSGSGKKPWRQKGTGRARVGEIRNPLWRHGGTVFGPQPRSYDFALPRKVKAGALRAALAAKLADGTLTVVDSLAAGRDENKNPKTKQTAAMFRKLGAAGKTLVIDVNHDDAFMLSARNIAGVTLKPTGRVTARDVIDTDHVIATKAALEKLQESLG
jgi:large subunit ribosomal protein L4